MRRGPRDRVVAAAAAAAHAGEAEGQHAAGEVAQELAAHEARQAAAVAGVGASEEGGQMLAQDAVQETLRGPAVSVGARGRPLRAGPSPRTELRLAGWRRPACGVARARDSGAGLWHSCETR